MGVRRSGRGQWRDTWDTSERQGLYLEAGLTVIAAALLAVVVVPVLLDV
ncbi:MAG: hypothetical protein ACRDUA_08175 [Micromonosporaceae bacterium]